MVRTEVKISMKKKYSACLYFKLLKSYVFRSIRTVVTTNRALCAYQSSGRTSTHSNLILITLQCSSKVTVDSIDTLPIKTLIQPRPKDNTQETFIRVSSNLRKIPRISIGQAIDRISLISLNARSVKNK
jgi:hypothetical protein